MSAPPSGVGDVDDTLLSSVLLLQPLFFCSARLEHSNVHVGIRSTRHLSLIHISEPTRLGMISYAVFCLKKKKQ